MVVTISDAPNLLISLATREDRRENCLPQFEREGIRVEVLDALTGADALRAGLRAFRGVSSGGLGCVASHLRAWQLIATSGAPFGLVYEDDVVLIEGFRARADEVISQAPGWELLQFGWFTCVRYPRAIRARVAVRTAVARRFSRYRVQRSLFRDGAHAYAIESALAGELAEFVDSTLCNVDHLLQVVSHFRSCYAVEPSIAQQAASFSDIANRNVGVR